MLMREYAAALNASAGGQHICVDSLEDELAQLPGEYAQPAGAIFLAFAESHPAGCVAIRPAHSADPSGKPACEMKRLWVRPEHQGRGMGRALAEKALAFARQRGYAAMVLDTMPSTMQSAYMLYHHLGFEPMEHSWPGPAAAPADATQIAFLRKAL